MVIIHTTKSQVRMLMDTFGKLKYDEAGNQTIEIPDWLYVMLEHSRGE